MDNKSIKNDTFIRDLMDKQTKLRDIRESLQANYNNRENSIVIHCIRDAEHWIEDQITSLK